MSAWQLSRWIEHECGYYVSVRTLQIRLSRGYTGERLIAKPHPNLARNPGRPRKRRLDPLSAWLRSPVVRA